MDDEIDKPKEMQSKIEIEVYDRNDFTVRVGDRYQERLCWDECVGLVSALIINGPDKAPLRTKAEHEAWYESIKARNTEVMNNATDR